MEPEFRLDRLPPDLIRRIIHVGSDSAADARLLSRTWNVLAKVYLCESPNLPSAIERVFFSRGVREDVYQGRPGGFERWLASGCLHMYTILPRKHLRRVGYTWLDGWLSDHKRHSGDFIEVTPKGMPPRIDKTFYRLARNTLVVVNSLLAWGLHWATSWIPSIEDITELDKLTPSTVLSTVTTCIPAVIFSGLLGVGIYYMVKMIIRRANDKQFDRFGRMFSMFTLIETLVLDNFRISLNCTASQEAFEVVMNALKGVQVYHLEVRENYLNKRLQNKIIQLCLSHNIRHVHITVQDANLHEFRNFVTSLTAIDVTLDLYERNGMNDELYFGNDKWFFANTAGRLQHISMRMATIHDPAFDKAAYRYSVKSHIRCEKLVGNIHTQPLIPVPEHRGFNHRWN